MDAEYDRKKENLYTTAYSNESRQSVKLRRLAVKQPAYYALREYIPIYILKCSASNYRLLAHTNLRKVLRSRQLFCIVLMNQTSVLTYFFTSYAALSRTICNEWFYHLSLIRKSAYNSDVVHGYTIKILIILLCTVVQQTCEEIVC